MAAPRRLSQRPRPLTLQGRRDVRHALASGAAQVVAITLRLDDLDLAVASVQAVRVPGSAAGADATPLDVVRLARRVDRRLRFLARRETVLRERLSDRRTRTTALRAPAAEFARRAATIRQEIDAALAVAALQTRAPGWERVWADHVAPVLDAPEAFAALAQRADVVDTASAPVVARLDAHRRTLLAVDADVRSGRTPPASALHTVATTTTAVSDVLDDAVDALLVTRFSPRHRRADPTYRGRQERRHLRTMTRSAVRLPRSPPCCSPATARPRTRSSR